MSSPITVRVPAYSYLLPTVFKKVACVCGRLFAHLIHCLWFADIPRMLDLELVRNVCKVRIVRA